MESEAGEGRDGRGREQLTRVEMAVDEIEAYTLDLMEGKVELLCGSTAGLVGMAVLLNTGSQRITGDQHPDRQGGAWRRV